MFIHYQGDDARQQVNQDVNGPNLLSVMGINYYSAKGDEFKKSQISRLDKFVQEIYYVNPDLAKYLPTRAKFMPYSNITKNLSTQVYSEFRTENLRICHAPSNRNVKGTERIIDAIESIQRQYPALILTLVENMRFSEALEIYRSSDLLIDQLYAGWYGGLAVEFLSGGIPVMAYIRDSDLGVVPDEMRREMAIIKVQESNLEEKILDFISKTVHERQDISRKSKAYAEKWHDSVEISAILIKEYTKKLK